MAGSGNRRCRTANQKSQHKHDGGESKRPNPGFDRFHCGLLSAGRSGNVPLAVRFVAPGPMRVRSLLITSSPLVSVVLPVTAKSMVSAGVASAIAWRSDPGPLSLRLVTVLIPLAQGARAHTKASAPSPPKH